MYIRFDLFRDVGKATLIVRVDIVKWFCIIFVVFINFPVRIDETNAHRIWFNNNVSFICFVDVNPLLVVTLTGIEHTKEDVDHLNVINIQLPKLFTW